MKQEQVILVDQHDNELGLEEKIRAHSLGLLHRAFSVFVFRQQDGHLELLLQQRNADKYHCGNLWTNTCCSHPRTGETVVAAAQRRLQEEMGLQLSLLLTGNFIYRAEFSNGLVEHEFDHVLIGMYDGSAINFNPEEVQAYRWVTLDQLALELANSPQSFTPWLQKALVIVQQNLQLLPQEL